MGGQAVTFQIIQASAHGSYALNGQDVLFRIAVTMTADHGSFAVSGQDATFRASMVSSHGSLQANGQDAAFRVGMISGEGSLALSGQDIQAIISMVADYGSFTLTGQDATLSVPDLPPAFDVDFVIASTKQDDLGLHMLADDQGWKVSSTDLDRLNLQLNDLGWKVIQASVRLNVKGE